MRRPVVSVVTPSLNQGAFIGDCIGSVRAQSYPRVQHLVLDACSTDETRRVLDGYASTYDLRATYEPDDGQADALNKGFARANGDVFCWLNADDYWLSPSVVEEAVAALEAGADVVTAGGVFVDEFGRELNPIPASAVATIRRELRMYDMILQPATFWRRSVHRPLDARLRFTFDWVLFLEMLGAGARLVSLPRTWAAYRWHASAKTTSDPAARKAELAAVLRAHCGPRSPQYLWASVIHAGYAAAERLDSRVLKRSFHWANYAVSALTRKRVSAS